MVKIHVQQPDLWIRLIGPKPEYLGLAIRGMGAYPAPLFHAQ